MSGLTAKNCLDSGQTPAETALAPAITLALYSNSHAGCVSPSDARDCIAQPAQRAHQPATSPESRQPSGRRSSCQRPKRRAIGNVELPAPSDLACEALRQQIASSLRAPAGSDDARNAPADKDLRSLAQMTTPRDGLPAPLLQGPCNAVCSPTCPGKPRQPRAPAAHQRALDNSSTRCQRFQQDAPSVPRTGAAVATSNGGFTAHFGSGVPSPLQFPCRFGARDGQKHLPDMNTPATTYRFSAASTGRRAELPMPWVPRNELKILLVRMAAIDCPMIRNSWKAGQ